MSSSKHLTLLAVLSCTACASSAPASTPPVANQAAEESSSPQGSAAGVGATPGSPGGYGGKGTPRLGDAAAEADPSLCQGCSIDELRRFRGRFRDIETCGDQDAEVFFPLQNPVIQVLKGEQAGQYFKLDVTGDILAEVEINTVLPNEVNPASWTLAILWVTDATGRPCASTLTILR